MPLAIISILMAEVILYNMKIILDIVLAFLGISYLYWTILAVIVALIFYIVNVSPLAIPKNPNKWIIKKYIFHYAHCTAFLAIGWMFYKLWKNNSSNWFTWFLGSIGIILFGVFIVTLILDRIHIKKLKESNSQKN